MCPESGLLVPSTYLSLYLAWLGLVGQMLGGADTGKAKITRGYRLPAYVVFTICFSSLPLSLYELFVMTDYLFFSFLFCFLDCTACTLSMLWVRYMIQMKRNSFQNNSNPVTRPPWTWQWTTQLAVLSVLPSSRNTGLTLY